MAKEEKDVMVEVETLTQIGVEGREGYVAKGTVMDISAKEAAKMPWAYALTRKPSPKAMKQVKDGVESGEIDQEQLDTLTTPPNAPALTDEEKAEAIAEAEAQRKADAEKEFNKKSGGKK